MASTVSGKSPWHGGLDPEPFNRYFARLAELAGTTVPYVFAVGDDYDQSKIDANFEAIVAALES